MWTIWNSELVAWITLGISLVVLSVTYLQYHNQLRREREAVEVVAKDMDSNIYACLRTSSLDWDDATVDVSAKYFKKGIWPITVGYYGIALTVLLPSLEDHEKLIPSLQGYLNSFLFEAGHGFVKITVTFSLSSKA